jgi:hypothetical protein
VSLASKDVVLDIGSCCAEGVYRLPLRVAVYRLHGNFNLRVEHKECQHCHDGHSIFFRLLEHGIWCTELDYPSMLDLSHIFLERGFHVEVLEVNRLLRNGLVKLSDIAFASFLNRNSSNAVEDLMHQSLANEWRRIAPFYRAASKHMEHLWFLPGNLGEHWKCLACAQNSDESEYCSNRYQADAHASSYRHMSNALSFRDEMIES